MKKWGVGKLLRCYVWEYSLSWIFCFVSAFHQIVLEWHRHGLLAIIRCVQKCVRVSLGQTLCRKFNFTINSSGNGMEVGDWMVIPWHAMMSVKTWHYVSNFKWMNC